MKPEILFHPDEMTVWGSPMPMRRGHVAIAPDAPKENIRPFIGRVNGKPVQFKNFIALPETLLLNKVHEDNRLEFLVSLGRHVCEDGQTRYVGWNRFLRPETKRFERGTTTDASISVVNDEVVVHCTGGGHPIWGEGPFQLAEALGGFGKLWKE